MKILCIIDFYLPGYKAGGPIRTLTNMVDRLGDEFQFKIVTADRDLKDTKPYSGININEWNKVGKADVFYMSPKMRSLRGFIKILCATEYDIIYLNSFFSPHFTIKPLILRRLRLIPDKSLIVAPRGEFSSGALGLKSFKKRAYLFAAQSLGLYRGVFWQASSNHEEADIRQWFGDKVPLVVAPDLPPLITAAEEPVAEMDKTRGALKIVFLSRISQKKNLYGALKMLKGLKGQVQFNIYGPMEDKDYWAECRKIISDLPENIKVRYCGSVVHENVAAVMREHDLFFLPTLGENFGHVILEALCAGCPVLISDQTPWRNLAERKVGWDIPLSAPDQFYAVLSEIIGMDASTFEEWSQSARKYGEEFSQNLALVQANRELFIKSLEQECGKASKSVMY